jgi:hypothetical protein
MKIFSIWIVQAIAFGHCVCLASCEGLQQVLADGESEPFIKQENLEQFILQMLQEWKTPGLALAILNGTSTWTRVSIN